MTENQGMMPPTASCPPWPAKVAALLALIAAVSILPAPACAQLSPAPAQASTTRTTAPGPAPASLEALETLAHQWSGLRSVRIVLETERSRDATPLRREITLAADRRMSLVMRSRDAAGTWNTSPDYFLYSDGIHARFKRGVKHYIEVPAESLWNMAPGPSSALLAPWPALGWWFARAQEAGMGVVQNPQGQLELSTTEREPWTLVWSPLGELREAWRDAATRRIGFLYQGSTQQPEPHSPAQASPYPFPRTIVERDLGEGDALVDVLWNVVEVHANPDDLEQHLAFDPSARGLLRFDPETGEIWTPDGQSRGREIMPAAKAVEEWEKAERVKSWSAVYVWGSVAVGLLIAGVIVDFIRRRL